MDSVSDILVFRQLLMLDHFTQLPVIREQIQLRKCCILEDSDVILEKISSGTLYVGGLDISYHKSDSVAFVGVSIVKIGNPGLNKQVI